MVFVLPGVPRMRARRNFADASNYFEAAPRISSNHPEATARGLVFLNESFFSDLDASWPSGVSLAYAGGHVRGVGANDPLSIRYFPHVDGIFASQQRDHDDMTHIKKRLGCALTQCRALNDD